MKKRSGNEVSPRSAKEAIHEAAIQLFAEKGYAATSTREICARAGVTKPVLYYHFGSKEQLFRSLVLDACNESRKQILLAARRGNTVRERLVEVVAAEFALTRRTPSLARMLLRMVFAPEKESPAVDYIEMALEWLRLLAGIISEGMRKGEIRGRPQEIAEALMGIHQLYTMGFLLTGKPKLDRALATRMVNLLLKGCRRNSTDR